MLYKKNLMCLLLALAGVYFYGCSDNPAGMKTGSSIASEKHSSLGNIDDSLIYHIDNQQDFDNLKQSNFLAGSMILFAKGAIFNGQFTPTGSGEEGNPIIIAAYDPTSGAIYTNENIDDKPIINGQGEVDSPVFIQNSQYVKIINLEVTNTDGSDENQGKLRGIHIKAKDVGVVHDVTVKYCYIHNVNGNVGGKKSGGIYINVYGDSVLTRFDHLRVENNVVENVGGGLV